MVFCVCSSLKSHGKCTLYLKTSNLLGGFFGGMLGILTCGYFSTFLLPVGVFVGVVGGWWYQEIWAATAHGFKEGVVMTQALSLFLFTPVRRLSEWRRQLWKRSNNLDLFMPMAALLAWIISPFIWLLCRPVAIITWTRAHPINRAYLVRASTLPVFCAAVAATIVPFAYLLVIYAQSFDWNHDVRVILIMFGGMGLLSFGVISMMVPYMLWSSESKLGQMHNFYRTWARYSSMGIARFYLSELWLMVRIWFSMEVWMVACILWFCGLGLIFLTIIAIASAVIGFVKGVYQVSIRGGQWLCFGATLTTTIVSAVVFHSSFGDMRVLWVVALLTGVASAGLTEGLRRGFILFFKANRPMRAVALVSLDQQLKLGGRLFWRITIGTKNRFVGLLPMHPQNA